MGRCLQWQAKQFGVEIQRCTFTDCVAKQGYGGGLAFEQLTGTTRVSGVQMNRVFAHRMGGGIAMVGAFEVVVSESSIANGEAGESGGLIHVDPLSKLKLIDVTLTNGTSPLGAMIKLGTTSTIDILATRFEALCTLCSSPSCATIYQDAGSSEFEVRLAVTLGCSHLACQCSHDR